jgi:hypothetical protein
MTFVVSLGDLGLAGGQRSQPGRAGPRWAAGARRLHCHHRCVRERDFAGLELSFRGSRGLPLGHDRVSLTHRPPTPLAGTPRESPRRGWHRAEGALPVP